MPTANPTTACRPGAARRPSSGKRPTGGYIAGASHDYILEKTPVENVVAMFDAVRDYGRY